ncbi:acetate/propionate family kinase [Salibaculum halophilum]|uniref:acetate/propionate family kinase n=1 Tax=Salibaculum halophilum TaxID=1914408 RepID=UPI000A10204D|nr:acetate kinase [Salibaculum halophilum]
MLLVLNTGSSSIKMALFRPDLEQVLEGQVTAIGGQARLSLGAAKKRLDATSHSAGIAAILDALEDQGITATDITAAAHRVVHGGTALTAPARLDDAAIAAIEANVPLAPLHNPPALAGIRAVTETLPDLPQYASFDTAFHADQPALATTYAIPAAWRAKGLRRYGFHGLSYAGMVAQFGDALPDRLLALHLGAGVSLCAIRDGTSLSTSMGYSPLSGPTMATRSGDIDGMAVLRMAEEIGIAAAGHLLNTDSGLAALGGTPDMRDLLADDSDAARFAVDHFVWSVTHQAGALIADMGGVDAVAFTGGIGEHSEEIRRRIMDRLAWVGPLPVHVIAAEEERQIARDALAVIGREG